eukprot:861486-Prorocentrum_lima.AAC.1
MGRGTSNPYIHSIAFGVMVGAIDMGSLLTLGKVVGIQPMLCEKSTPNIRVGSAWLPLSALWCMYAKESRWRR